MFEAALILSFLYRIIVSVFGAWVAYKGICKFESSSTKTGEIEKPASGLLRSRLEAPARCLEVFPLSLPRDGIPLALV
jgi:hypothetical protein